MSDEYNQETTVPQGSIISTTLFIIKINNIIERKLQLSIYKLEQWADLNGFKFSQDKTKVIHFCHKRTDPELYLNKHPISVVRDKIPRYNI